jgi:signal transduction histidine kinase
LRPPTLDTVGLIPALESRISEFNQQEYYLISFQTRVDESQEISEATTVCLFRVFEEAMSNIKKHSAATQVKIEVEVGSNEVRLSVEDNGVGFSIPSRMGDFVRNYHFGLVGIREMLEAVGGRLSVESAPGKGCRIIATVPRDETNPVLKEGISQ